MNKLVTIGLIGALVFGVAQPVKAGDREWAAAAGLLGGIIIGSQYNSHSHHTIEYGYRTMPGSGSCDTYRPPREPEGHYEYRTERVWVPGCWEYEYNSCGRRVSYWRPGYYKTYETRIWVSHCR